MERSGDGALHTSPKRYSQNERCGVQRKTVEAPMTRAGFMLAPEKRAPVPHDQRSRDVANSAS